MARHPDTHPDHTSWGHAESLLDLGQLTAAWLEGAITSQPGHPTGNVPAQETRPLVDVLARANRAGFVTDTSRPGYSPHLENDDTVTSQRGAVGGWIDAERADDLAAQATAAGLLVITDTVGGRGDHSPDGGLIVSTHDHDAGERIGTRRTRRDVERHYDICQDAMIDALLDAVYVAIAEPDYGPGTRIWGFLRDWAGRQHDIIESLNPQRAAYRDRAHFAAVLAALPGITARLQADKGGDPGRATVLFLNGPTGQITIHLDDVDLELFEHVPWARPGDPHAVWDGHTKADARLRLRELVQVLAFPARTRSSDVGPWETGADVFNHMC